MQAYEEIGRFFEQRAEPLLPAWARRVGKRVHVHVAVSRVPEDRHRDPVALGRRADPADVRAELLERHAPVLDHLQRALRVAPACERGAGQAADRPQAFEAGAIHRGLHVARQRFQAAYRVSNHAAGGGAGLALELDQQHAGQAGGKLRPRLAGEFEERGVEQLDRGWVERDQVRHGLSQRVEASESQHGARDIGRNGVEAPLHRGHERERPFGPHQQIHLIPSLRVAVEGVPTRALAGAGEAGTDEVPRRRRERPPGGIPIAPCHAPRGAVGLHHLHRVDPAAHAAAADGARPGGIGCRHASRRRETCRGWIGGQAQTERACCLVYLGAGDRGSHTHGPRAPIGSHRAEPLAQVDNHAAADAATRHAAPRAAGNERRARRGSPAHDLLQLLHVPRHGDGRGNDAVDPGAFGIGGADPSVGQQGRVRGRWCVVGHAPKLPRATHYVPRTTRASFALDTA